MLDLLAVFDWIYRCVSSYSEEEYNIMPKYTVHYMAPVISYEDIEAKDEQKAIEQVANDPMAGILDPADGPYDYVVCEEDL